MSTFYTSVLFICSLLTAFLTAKPAYNTARWNYLQSQDNRERIIFWISIMTLCFTQIKSCDDSKASAAQQKDFNDTLTKREVRYTHRVDSMAKAFSDSLRSSGENTTKILSRYGYKVDSLNQILVRDTGRKIMVTNNYGAKPTLNFGDSIITLKSIKSDGFVFELYFLSSGAVCDSFKIKAKTAVVIDGKYFKIPGEWNLLGINDVVPTTNTYVSPISLGGRTDTKRFYFYVYGTYSNGRKRFSKVLTYSVSDKGGGIATEFYTNEITNLFQH